ncbi:hypothetical protein Q7I21_01915 [Aeromonas veronii]|uniref:hypothetical protein n=1 Tax=Aeromonas veronii TaxID=654 RepID=UPI00300459CD
MNLTQSQIERLNACKLRSKAKLLLLKKSKDMSAEQLRLGLIDVYERIDEMHDILLQG